VFLHERQDVVLIHGITHRKTDEEGMWHHSDRFSYVSPEEYLARIKAVLQEGLRPTLRDAGNLGMLAGPDRPMKRVYFFEYGPSNSSYYGYVNVLLRTGNKFAVIIGNNGVSAGTATGFIHTPELIIISKDNIKEQFTLLLNPGTLHYEMYEWAVKVRALLKREGLVVVEEQPALV
jgi:hypothetical protein